MASRESMNMGSRTSNVLSELKSLISGMRQETVLLKQEWNNLVGVMGTGASRMQGTGGRAAAPTGAPNQIAPDPVFTTAPQLSPLTEGGQQAIGGNTVFSGPGNTIVPAGAAQGPVNLSSYVAANPKTGTLYTPAVGAGGAGYGGGNNNGGNGGYVGGTNDPAGDPNAYYKGGGDQSFGYNSSGGTQGSSFFSKIASGVGAASGGIGAALGGFGLIGNMVPSTASLVEANLLQQRASFFTGSGYNQAVTNQANLAKLGTLSSDSPELDAMKAMVAAQSYGLNSPNFNSVMQGAANVSNILPGVGLEGTVRATGAMQQAKNVNMLKGIGIQLRDDQGNLKPPDEVIADVWKKICKDYAQAYGSTAKAPSLREVQIGLQPGNSLDAMLDQYFGNDPILKQMVTNGLIYKATASSGTAAANAVSGGATIDKAGALAAGATTNAVLSYSTRGAASAGVLGDVASNLGGFEAANKLLTEFSNSFGRGLAAAILPVKEFTDTLLAASGGAGGSILDTLATLAPKAAGGPVTGSTPYLVGEQGPEIFVPSSSGNIIPNNQLSGMPTGGPGNTYNFTVNLPNANTPEVIGALKALMAELDTNQKVSTM